MYMVQNPPKYDDVICEQPLMVIEYPLVAVKDVQKR